MLHVELINEDKKSDLIPDELYEKPKITMGKIINNARDCEKFKLAPDRYKNTIIIFRTEGLESFRFKDQIINIVPEMFIVGQLDD